MSAIRLSRYFTPLAPHLWATALCRLSCHPGSAVFHSLEKSRTGMARPAYLATFSLWRATTWSMPSRLMGLEALAIRLFSIPIPSRLPSRTTSENSLSEKFWSVLMG